MQRWQRIAMSEEDAHASIDRELARNVMLGVCPVLGGACNVSDYNGIFATLTMIR